MDYNEKMDILEAAMLCSDLPTVDCPLKHFFFWGVYMRVIFMPKGSKVTSLIHKTLHPFILFSGKVEVYSENDGVQILEGFHVGVTKPGTRRFLNVLENCVWATFHKTDVVPENDSEEAVQKAVDEIGLNIIDFRENPLIGGVVKNNELLTN